MKKMSLVPVSTATGPASTFQAFGCHGTCMSRATSITNKGFTPSKEGRRGSGTYFWYAETEKCRYAYSLAEAWFKAASKQNAYRDEPDTTGAVLWGTISAPEEEVLNLENPVFRDALRQALTKHWSTIDVKDSGKKEELVSSVHEMLIRRTEEKHPVSLVLATVQQPKMSDEHFVYVGQPFAIIVRKLSCLKLDSKIEDIPYEP